MKVSQTSRQLVSILVLAVAGGGFAACSSSSSNSGTGGHGGADAGAGGHIADAGTGGHAADAGTGGVTGTGGAASDAGTGGLTGTGGATGDAGTGGITGTGGVTSDAATDGASDAASAFVAIATFDSSLQGWSVLQNLPDAGTGATATPDSTVGQPSPGSAKLVIPFVNNTAPANEQVDFGIGMTAANWAGKTLTMLVMLDAGQTATGLGAQIILKSGTSFVYANGGFQNLVAGTWVTLTVPVSAPGGFVATGFDPTQIVEVDVEIQANNTNSFTTTTVHVDTIGIH